MVALCRPLVFNLVALILWAPPLTSRTWPQLLTSWAYMGDGQKICVQHQLHSLLGTVRGKSIYIYIYVKMNECIYRNNTHAILHLQSLWIYGTLIYIYTQYICIWSWAPVRSWPSQCQAWSCCFTTLFSTVVACYGRWACLKKHGISTKMVMNQWI